MKKKNNLQGNKNFRSWKDGNHVTKSRKKNVTKWKSWELKFRKKRTKMFGLCRIWKRYFANPNPNPTCVDEFESENSRWKPNESESDRIRIRCSALEPSVPVFFSSFQALKILLTVLRSRSRGWKWQGPCGPRDQVGWWLFFLAPCLILKVAQNFQNETFSKDLTSYNDGNKVSFGALDSVLY